MWTNLKNMKCKVCINSENNQEIIAKEMMFGTKEEFTYLECSNCGCLQIKVVPTNMEKYYGESYYSFSDNVKTFNHTSKSKRWDWLKEFFQKELILHRLGKGFRPIGQLMKYKERDYLRWMAPQLNINFDSKILDVGSGRGKLLKKMKSFGFKNLTGIDPFLAEDAIKQPGLNVLKKDLFEVDEKYDLIMLHHSFEHMESPSKVIEHLSKSLNPKGVLLIRIPVADSYAYRTYGINWVELDAPRHYFLHTKKSIHHLAEQNGLKVDHIAYDSTHFEIIGSERYLQGLNFSDPKTIFSNEEKKKIAEQVEKLNQSHDASRACFYLIKN